jgi:hypothetical protein
LHDYLQSLWFQRLDTQYRSIGVINAESSLPHLIGRGRRRWKTSHECSNRFCQILAYVGEKEHENEIG